MSNYIQARIATEELRWRAIFSVGKSFVCKDCNQFSVYRISRTGIAEKKSLHRDFLGAATEAIRAT